MSHPDNGLDLDVQNPGTNFLGLRKRCLVVRSRLSLKTSSFELLTLRSLSLILGFLFINNSKGDFPKKVVVALCVNNK